jgi:rhodanese-related sulfurtransferase
MNRPVLALAALLVAAPGLPRAAADEPFGMLSVEEVSSLLGSKGVAVLDANPPDLFTRAHVPGARLLSYKDVSPQTLPSDKGTTLIFYCHNRK